MKWLAKITSKKKQNFVSDKNINNVWLYKRAIKIDKNNKNFEFGGKWM